MTKTRSIRFRKRRRGGRKTVKRRGGKRRSRVIKRGGGRRRSRVSKRGGRRRSRMRRGGIPGPACCSESHGCLCKATIDANGDWVHTQIKKIPTKKAEQTL